MPQKEMMVNCTHCGKIWNKSDLSRSCSNCFGCTGCEAYLCPECSYEIVITPPKPMARKKKEE